jgi:DNA-binding NtrC family response regulator
MLNFKETILIADDDPNIIKILKDRLENKGFRIITASNGVEALALSKGQSPDIAILDLQMPMMTGIEVLQEIKKHNLDITTIFLTAYGTIELAVQAMKKGAYDFIQKPVDFEHLEIVINKALERNYLKKKSERLESQLQESEEEISYLRREVGGQYEFSSIIGKDKALQEILNTIKKVVDQKSTIIILGESGTGKELLARAIHYNSKRRDKKFVAVNCGAIPKELLESEFFGHVKGSFTNAHKTRHGYFEEADQGTLFLDEIGELDLELQVKLLRALERGEILKVGNPQPIKIDIRFIAATNKNLFEQVKTGAFRKDLYYRLNVIPLTLPPLKDRKEDIPLLIEHFLKKHSTTSGKGAYKLSDESMTLFMRYSYPGNVRELENLIERSIILSDHPLIVPKDLPIELKEQKDNFLETLNIKTDKTALKNVSTAVRLSAEKQMILDTLRECNYNCTKTARMLKISRSSLYNKIKKCNIQLNK